MGKRLKLGNLATSKGSRSSKTVVNEGPSEKTSPYFADDGKATETGTKKRELIKDKRETTDDKGDLEKTSGTPIVEKSEKSKVSTDVIKTEKIKTEVIETEKIKTDEIKTKTIKTEGIKTEKRVTENKNVETDSKSTEDKKRWMPFNWEVILKNIKEMRKDKTAPVDTMGCHKCADPNASPKVSRYQSLVALMLSSQTKDPVVYAAMQRLNTYGCKPDIIAATPDDVLSKLIYPVGFYKRKVGFIKRTTTTLIDKYGGDIPKTAEELCELPGVGPKMAHLCMKNAWGEVSGIGVDTHVHRISNRLNWVRKPTKTPEGTRIDLEDWLPKPLWSEVNHLLVGFGQEICLPRFPKCSECLNKDICPFASKSGGKKK
ncbi:hypothetical protein PUN28_005476 [Cardiocondyla obscurior]|uniref:Endonuclease III homolog n=1 Tax=Cardiocondyla obscurior TaxID=286306 RepID=A0AAW2GIX7_9HYME